jgi:N-acetyl sugar amidotransferase
MGNYSTPSFLEAKYGLPQEVKFCTRCVISNQRPNSTVEFASSGEKKETISFDEEGVCSACRYAEIKDKSIDWQEREKELFELCNRFRKSDGSYDCIVPGSGGKDSAFTSHILKHKYKMNPLTVTWAPHVYTEIGWKNFQSWIMSGFDNYLVSPNGAVHRKLTKLAFENLLHPFQPFIVGQRMVAPHFSVRMNIPLVFYGENQAEYGHNIAENFNPRMKETFFSSENPRDLQNLRLGGYTGEELVSMHGLSVSDLAPYFPVFTGDIKRVKTEVHYLGYYLKWDPQECYYYATEHTGFKPNVERTEGSYSKYSSIDDRIDPFHYYTTYIKFGIGRATYDAAQEIRNGKITREEGVELVKKYDHEFPKKYYEEMLKYMDISHERFCECIDLARSPHLWSKEGQEWKLRHAVWMV